jgi:predicted nucleic acid-binding protein
MTDELVFIDTNVLVYAYDRTAGQKHLMARSLLAELWASRRGLMSTQVMQEFYVNVTRKLPRPLPASRARAIIAGYATWPVHQVAPTDIIEASRLQGRQQLSFWDCLVVVAASRMGATTLLTEDLQHGRTIAGVRIINPFADSDRPS